MAGSGPLGPFRLLWAPAFYIFLSIFCLGQFRIFYGYFTTVARSKATNIVAENILPVLRQWLTFMESSLGPASKFTPSTTHVLMVALMLVILARQN